MKKADSKSPDIFDFSGVSAEVYSHFGHSVVMYPNGYLEFFHDDNRGSTKQIFLSPGVANEFRSRFGDLINMRYPIESDMIELLDEFSKRGQHINAPIQ